MLSKKMYQQLNSQINLEFYSSNLYLQMSSWFLNHGFEGCGAFMRQHADEERDHMFRLFDYVNETGLYATLEEIEAPRADFSDLKEVFEETFKHEQFITKRINEVTAAAFKENDFSTFNFLQWYVSEQHEEEQLFKGILDKINLIGSDNKQGLFMIDQELARLTLEGSPSSVVEADTQA